VSRPLSRTRTGFTLIELLVVIAIIAILIGLLLPAVQKVREAAARMQCSNNLKQLSLALHNYHDANGFMPPGGLTDAPPVGTGGGWGSSWVVLVLPYIEQDNLRNRFTFPGGSGWGSGNNPAQASNIRIKTINCPSSPTGDVIAAGDRPPGSAGDIAANHYVGIAGAVPGLIPGYNDNRFNTSGTGAGCCSGGIAAGNGVLRPGTPDVKMTSITDGTSNTIVIGEQNDFLFTANGTRVRWGTGMQHGFMIGWPRTQTPPNAGNGGDVRHFNMTTVRYQVNQKRNWTDGGACGTQGVCQNVGNNIPLNSAHTGGINVGMGDGSVRFLRDSTPLVTLAQLAIRDDGTVINDF
jgi:prepilin-type N-terminal cleavage/methylation domain-containing protein/prepilin-type processing-associated H-X9-DG protein